MNDSVIYTDSINSQSNNVIANECNNRKEVLTLIRWPGKFEQIQWENKNIGYP